MTTSTETLNNQSFWNKKKGQQYANGIHKIEQLPRQKKQAPLKDDDTPLGGFSANENIMPITFETLQERLKATSLNKGQLSSLTNEESLKHYDLDCQLCDYQQLSANGTIFKALIVLNGPPCIYILSVDEASLHTAFSLAKVVFRTSLTPGFELPPKYAKLLRELCLKNNMTFNYPYDPKEDLWQLDASDKLIPTNQNCQHETPTPNSR